MTGKAWPAIMPLLLAGCLTTGAAMVEHREVPGDDAIGD